MLVLVALAAQMPAAHAGLVPTVGCSSTGYIFNTAYSGNSAGPAKAVGSRDTYWEANTSARDTPAPYTVDESQWTDAYVVGQRPGWASSPFNNADWIAHNADGSSPLPLQRYTYWYRYRFYLDPALDPAVFYMKLSFYADDSIGAVYVNGINQPNASITDDINGNNYGPGRGASMVLDNGWKTGLNEIRVRIADRSYLSGLLVQYDSQSSTICSTSAQVQAITTAGSSSFSYSGTNGVAAQTLTTTGASVAAPGPQQWLAASNQQTTITQIADAPGYRLQAIACTGLAPGASVSYNTTGMASGGVPARSVLFSNAGNGRNVVCRFTNQPVGNGGAYWDGNGTAGDGTVTGGPGSWNATNTNWTDVNGASNAVWAANGVATFTGNGGSVTVSGAQTIGGLYFQGAGYAVSGATLTGGLANNPLTADAGVSAIVGSVLAGGTHGFSKEGGGTITLSGANTYTGATAVNGGTLAITGGSYATSAFAIAANAVMVFNSGTGLMDMPTTTFSGAGTLRKTGTGTLQWGGSAATFSLGAGSAIDVQNGTFTGGSNGNEVWTNNKSALTVAGGATFQTVEAGVMVDALNGAGSVVTGYYPSWPGSGLTVGVNNGGGTFSGVISDGPGVNTATKSLTKTGTGTQMLSGANTYTGTTVVNGGTLLLAAAANTNAINPSSAMTVGTGATLSLGANAAQSLASLDASAGKVDLGSSGALTITGNSSIGTVAGTGTITVTGGTLTLPSGFANPGLSIVLKGGALALGAGQTYSVRALTVDSTVTNAAVDMSSAGTASLSAGTLTLNNALAVTHWTVGTSHVYASGIVGSRARDTVNTAPLNKVTLGSSTASATYWASSTNELLVAGALTYWDGPASNTSAVEGGSGTWDTGSNWTTSSGTPNGVWAGGTSVANFTATPGTVGVTGTRDIGGLNFAPASTASNYLIQNGTLRGNSASNPLTVASGATATIASVLAGSPTTNAFSKEGAGTLLLTGANTYTGSTAVNGGTLQLGNGGTTGSLASTGASIAGGATLAYYRADASYTVPGTLSGAGTLALLGTGVGGGTSVYTLGNAAATTLSGTIAVGSGAKLMAAGSLGTATIAMAAYGTLHLTGGTMANAVQVQGDGWRDASGAFLGALRFEGGAVLAGNVTLTGNARLGAWNSYDSGTISGAISGNYGLTRYTGQGTVVLSGTNTYGGATSVLSGQLVAGSSSALGSAAAGTSVGNGATLALQDNIAIAAEPLSLSGAGYGGNGRLCGTGALCNASGSNGFGGPVTLATAASIGSAAGTLTLTGGIAGGTGGPFALSFDGAGATVVNSAIAASVSTLTKTGSGTLTLGAANSYAGATTVSAGKLVTGIDRALPTGSAATVGNGATLSLAGSAQRLASLTAVGTATLDLGSNGTLTLTSGTSQLAGANVQGSGRIVVNTGATLVLTSALASANVDVELAGGTLQLGAYAHRIGTLTVSASSKLDFDAAQSRLWATNLAMAAGGTQSLSATHWTQGTNVFQANQINGTATTARDTLGLAPLNRIAMGSFATSATLWRPSGAPVPDEITAGLSPTVTGMVFDDGGAPTVAGNTGTPNDGLRNGGEGGVAGATVRLTNCASTVYTSTTTDASGAYALRVPLQQMGQTLCVAAAPARPVDGTATGANASGTVLPSGTATTVGGLAYTYTRASQQVSFTAPAAGALVLNFGRVPPSTLTPAASSQQNAAHTRAVHAHVFTPGTGGTLAVTLGATTTTPTPGLPGWSEIAYLDPGCTGTAQPNAQRLYPSGAPLTVVQGQAVCFVVQQQIPAQAANGHANAVPVTATLSFGNASPALSATYTATDTTTASSSAVRLNKEVRNITQGGTFGTTNQARSGDVLDYRITYTNATTGVVRNFVVNDATPPYTTFQGATAASTPTDLGSCTKVTPANLPPAPTAGCATSQAAGGSGLLQWLFTGTLPAGASGSVGYQVKVD